MNTVNTQYLYGGTAYLSAIFTILTFITGILFFSIGKPFGKINDISSVFQVLFMIPLAFLFNALIPPELQWPGWAAALAGISGMLITTYGQGLLIFNKIDFETSMKFFPAGLLIGIWLISINSLALTMNTLPGVLLWVGILAGIGYIATVVGFLRGGQNNIVFYSGGFILATSYPVWAFWLGRLIFTGLVGIG